MNCELGRIWEEVIMSSKYFEELSHYLIRWIEKKIEEILS
jgi:hypothetical protein